MFSVFRNIQRYFPNLRNHVTKYRSRNANLTVLGSAYAAAFVKANEENAIKAEDATTLTHAYLIKNAAIACVDSASALLTQTTSNLLELEEEYARALAKLARLFEMSIEHLDSEQRQALCWEAIVEVRHEVTALRAQRQEMASLYYAADRMLHSAAEAAMHAGAEYASIAAGERAFSAQSRLSGCQGQRAEAEARANKMEAEYIHKSSEHFKDKQRQKADDNEAEEYGEGGGNVVQGGEEDSSRPLTKDEEQEIGIYSEFESYKEKENVGD